MDDHNLPKRDLPDRDIIVFGEDWGGLPSSTQQLIAQLSANRTVIWVNSIGLRQPKFSLQDAKRIGNKLTRIFTPSKISGTKKDRFIVVNLRAIPAPKNAFFRTVNATYLAYQVNKLIQKYHLVHPILWISLPTAVDIVGRINESAVVYYCCDDFSALAGVDHATVSQRETELSHCADLIITSSQILSDKFDQSKTVTVDHGVDYQLFTTPSQRAIDLPNNKLIAGYYGSISSWLDIDLLVEAIGELPQWNFVFIGEVNVDISQLKRFPNVYFLGKRAHDALPSYSQHWDASLLPFRDTPQIYACNPFKLREYLAVARPIISTDFPAITPYKTLIEVVSNASQMIDALRKISLNQPLDLRKRRAVAQHTWQSRAVTVSRLLERL